MSTPPDDCAIEVHYVDKMPFRLERIPSHGPFHQHIHCDDAGNMTITYHGQEPHRFAISFRLSDGGNSGGFAGIKVWKGLPKPPEHRYLPGRGVTEKIPGTALDLHTFFTENETPEKATLLSIGDTFGERGKFHYCLGIYRDKDRNEDNIAWDDPRIYNNWEPPQRLGCLGRILSFSR